MLTEGCAKHWREMPGIYGRLSAKTPINSINRALLSPSQTLIESTKKWKERREGENWASETLNLWPLP